MGPMARMVQEAEVVGNTVRIVFDWNLLSRAELGQLAAWNLRSWFYAIGPSGGILLFLAAGILTVTIQQSDGESHPCRPMLLGGGAVIVGLFAGAWRLKEYTAKLAWLGGAAWVGEESRMGTLALIPVALGLVIFALSVSCSIVASCSAPSPVKPPNGHD